MIQLLINADSPETAYYYAVLNGVNTGGMSGGLTINAGAWVHVPQTPENALAILDWHERATDEVGALLQHTYGL